jgi:hypothetical protein
MKTSLLLRVECGETTCAEEPGKFCVYMGAISFGQKSVCLLFPDVENAKGSGGYTVLEEKDGWVRRCAECLSAERDGRVEAAVNYLTALRPGKPVDLSDGWELLAEHGDWQHWHAINTPNEHVICNKAEGGQVSCFGFWGFTYFHALAFGESKYACPEGCNHQPRKEHGR